MHSHAPFEPIATTFCMWARVGDVITDAKFHGNRLKSFGVTGPPTPFPILKVHRPYNSVSSTVLHCDSVSVVRTTFKVYGKRQILTLSQPKTPKPIVTKFEWRDYVVNAYHPKNLSSIRPEIFARHIGEIYIPFVRNLLHFFGSSTRLQASPLDRFLR